MQSNLDHVYTPVNHRMVCIVLAAVDVFVGLAAVVGGVALLAGAIQLPVEWLRGTPFTSYQIPGLVLAIAVGGSALVAAATMRASRVAGPLVSLAAGVILVGWITSQVAMLGLISWLQPLFFALGLVTIGLAVRLWAADLRRRS